MSPLREYRSKRPPGKSPEPRGGRPSANENIFVVQRHDATRLHYDFRLEMGGVLKSWAVPKGPSLDPSVKRLAIQTEDHPLDYGSFEGTIPEGNYGAGEVILWDRGTYKPDGEVPAEEQFSRGEIKFVLRGRKLNGGFVLVRLRAANAKREWLLIKHRDQNARTDWQIQENEYSVKSGKPPGPPRHASRERTARIILSGAKDLSGARKTGFPIGIRPALANLSEKPFSSDDWQFEIKWDGIRAIARIKNGSAQLFSRTNRDISAEYPEFADLAKHVRSRDAILDGEVVVLDAEGRSDFQRLQSRFGVQNPAAKQRSDFPVTFFFFDVLYCDGFDVRRAPLFERKQLLERILITSERVRISEHVVGNGLELFNEARRKGLEGLIAKRIDSVYPIGRTSSWLKFKTTREIDGVVGGWTDPRGARRHFGSLLVGMYEGSNLRFVGGVGTGYSNEVEAAILEKLKKLSVSECPFAAEPGTRVHAHWVAPKLVVRVGYAEWTSDRKLRQPRFLGLQPDRSPAESTFEKEGKPAAAPDALFEARKPPAMRASSPGSRKNPIRGAGLTDVLAALGEKKEERVSLILDGHQVNLSHLDKIYFPKGGYTKRDVLAYYAAVSPYLLPFLKDRPLVLHRYPNGIGKTAFYQKEAGPGIPSWIRTVDIYSESKHHDVAYFLIDGLAALLYLTNLGCIEHNPFSARADDLKKPDYMFVDLDPTEGTAFSRVRAAAEAIGRVLKFAKLEFFFKTSGATGVHMFIPIARKYGFEQVRAFLEIVTRIAFDREKELLTRTFKVQDRPKNSVFVDVRQNAYAQSLASVFSLRPRELAPVSTPVSESELRTRLQPDEWNIKSVLKDLSSRANLWSGFWKRQQTLESAVSALDGAKGAWTA